MSIVMVWGAIAAIALFTLAGLVGVTRRAPALWTILGTFVLLGLAGYAWQGSPGIAAAERRPEGPQAVPFGAPLEPADADATRAAVTAAVDRFGPAGQWLGLSGAMMRQGRPGDAATILAKGTRQYPDSFDLWLAQAGALVAHGGGRLSPAAELAFDRAAAIDPAHPGPAFLRGLALAESGDLAGADASWSELVATAPADAPWRSDVEERLTFLRAVAARQAPLGGAPAGRARPEGVSPAPRAPAAR